MKATITLLPGDGIGPEVTHEAKRVLLAIAEFFGHQFEMREAYLGGCAMDYCGEPLPERTAQLCLESDAVLLGAIGGPKWDNPKATVRPEQGLLGLRKLLDVYANLRPVRAFEPLFHASPLKPERIQGVDIAVVRELTSGIYFGQKTRTSDTATDECIYTKDEIERIARFAFELARTRTGHVVSVDKANVLETSRLWRETVTQLAEREYPTLHLEHMLVDAAAMKLIQQPSYFDVLVTENMFGDILTDEASVISGSLGVLPSASLGEGHRGLYEPVHGSAPDIAGLGIANPIGAILSVALMLRHSFALETEAQAVETAVVEVMRAGMFTPDVALPEHGQVTTRQVGEAVIAAITANEAWY
ncbi:MAG: 3-isopropylmalate dehydrogenase [Acidobacteria bacterium]|nr:3-isopropylmalate dehydrogenase [Acidobacteriota bacterium]